MKKIFILVICYLVIHGCKKSPFDYRTKFLGNYNFIIHSSSYDPFNGSRDTIYLQDGNIGCGSEKDKVLISFFGKGTSEFIVYEDGTMEGNGCSGEFESTYKVKYSCYWASPASHTSNEITGEKK